MTRRVQLTISSLLAALALASCGGSSGGSNEDQIRDLAKSFAQNAKAKRFDDLCEQLSAKAQAQISVAGALLGGGGCPKVMEKALALDDSADSLAKIDPDKVRVTGLKITGDRAVGQMTPSSDGDGTTRFVREHGAWKIDADPEDNDNASASTTAGDESDDNSTPAPTLSVAERGFSRRDDSTTYGVVVKNDGDTDAIGVEVQVNLLGADDDVIATETENLAGVPAGEEMGIGGESDTKGERVRRLEVTVTADSGGPSNTVTLPEVSRVKLIHEEFGGLSVRAQVTNSSDETLSQITDVFAILRDADGDIVGGISGFPENDIQPGGRAAVEVGRLTDVPGAVNADVTVDTETS